GFSNLADFADPATLQQQVDERDAEIKTLQKTIADKDAKFVTLQGITAKHFEQLQESVRLFNSTGDLALRHAQAM
ncbi:hypothetical protein L915_02453, partial [Phytophthora nicotianae]